METATPTICINPMMSDIMVAQILMKATILLPIPIITTTLIVEMVMYSNLVLFFRWLLWQIVLIYIFLPCFVNDIIFGFNICAVYICIHTRRL